MAQRLATRLSIPQLLLSLDLPAALGAAAAEPAARLALERGVRRALENALLT